jgi:tetratricopeptide (TPR) repeat protein
MGWGLRQFGRYADAVPVLEEAIEVATVAGLYNTVQWALADLGVTLIHLGQLDAARERFEQARAASEEIGDGAGEVLAAYGHAVLARVTQDWPQARALYARSAKGFEELRTPVPGGLALAGLARCDEQDGLLEAARSGYRRVLELGDAAGEPSLIASALEGLSRIAATEGDAAEAFSLRDKANDVRQGAGRPAPPHEQAEVAAMSVAN